MSNLTHKKKIEWMATWCAKNGLMLQLDGSCGFGRDCVGVSDGDSYADYNWFDENGFHVKKGAQEIDPRMGPIAFLLGKHKFVRMVKGSNE